jgi:hypothetical protein
VRHERPSAAARRSRAKITPHSHRDTPVYPDPATGRTWPPRGWTYEAIHVFRRHHERTDRFLRAWGAAQRNPNFDRQIDTAAARLRELSQFGADPATAGEALREAHTALLDLKALARADTHPIYRPDPLRLPSRRPDRDPWRAAP